LSKLKQGLYI